MTQKLIFYLLFSLFALLAYAQEQQLALPKVVNYTSDIYKGGFQNWDIAEDKQGVIYVGNNEGLLTYNGSSWHRYPLPNRTLVRSLGIASDDKVYIGAQDEIGYFYPDERGVLLYHSLKSLIPSTERSFGDVWNLVIQSRGVFFRETNKIFHYHQGIVHVYKPSGEWSFLGNLGDRLLAQDRGKALMEFKNGIWEPVSTDPSICNATITGVLPSHHEEIIITTLNDGLFTLHPDGHISKKMTALDADFEKYHIYCSAMSSQGEYIFGTSSGGVFFMNVEGQLTQHYANNEGLQTDNVRKIFIDNQKNLWLGLDDGIAYIGINNAIKYIYPDPEKQLSTYAIKQYKNQLYIGTSNGVFSFPTTNKDDLSLCIGRFKPIDNTYGQVWNLNEINGVLLLAHERGSFAIDPYQSIQIYSFPGTWLFQSGSAVYPSRHIIAGTYTGLQHLYYENGQLADSGHMGALYESLRFVVIDEPSNTIWASHPVRGVYRIQLNDDLSIKKTDIYQQEQGLPSNLYNYVYRLKNEIVVSTEDGIYEFDTTENRFKSSTALAILQGIPIQYLKEDGDGNIWFVSNKNVGVVRQTEKGKSKIMYFPEIRNLVVGGHEFIYPLNMENVFIGSRKGVIHINLHNYLKKAKQPQALITLIKAVGDQDSIIFGGYHTIAGHISTSQDSINLPQLPYHMNALHFEFASTLYNQQGVVEFSYQLTGFDREWSPWDSKHEKDYTNLPPGDYIFKVRTRNNLGTLSKEASYAFRICAPWYNNTASRLIYFCLSLILLFALLKWQKQKYLRAHEKQRYLHQLEIENTEKEIVRLKNEKLEADISFKNKELSTMAMHLLQRGEVLHKVKDTLSLIKQKTDSTHDNTFRQLNRLIKEVEKTDEDWEHFSMHFNQVNENFFHLLKEKHPQLTSNELKLCAYIRMSLSTKEIAQLMNITTKAIEIGRYRLRKKLDLSPEVNLYDYLLNVSRGSTHHS